MESGGSVRVVEINACTRFIIEACYVKKWNKRMDYLVRSVIQRGRERVRRGRIAKINIKSSSWTRNGRRWISRSGGILFTPLNKRVELREKREETKKTILLTKIILLLVDPPFSLAYALWNAASTWQSNYKRWGETVKNKILRFLYIPR